MSRFGLCLAGCFLAWALWISPQALGQAAGGGAGGGVASKENLDLPFDSLGQSEDEEEAPELIVFYGQQYEGDGVFFSLDKSGSMNEANKFNRLKQEVVKNISQFSSRVQFGINFFDATQNAFPPSKRPADASPAMKQAALSYVSSMQPGHGTCSKESLIVCLTMANQATSKRKLIIHLSDGENFCPGQDETQYTNSLLSEVKSRNTQHVKINAICITTSGAGEPFMKKLASQNNGTYARISQ